MPSSPNGTIQDPTSKSPSSDDAPGGSASDRLSDYGSSPKGSSMRRNLLPGASASGSGGISAGADLGADLSAGAGLAASASAGLQGAVRGAGHLAAGLSTDAMH